ncbi:HVA22-like protein a [Tanacetum coccineum]|uniref:HVA22-like protein n=1 Tax=Tanacetum coccineum TaxID=301880 RepID=A0ABQ5EJN5_9ASTR
MGKPGAAAGDLLLLIAQNLDVLAGPLVSLAYPLYASIRAIETRNVTDDQQWLTYWVLYSMITLFELTFYSLVEWVPFWSYAKLIITCWLVMPQFSGATYVYQHYVRPFYTGNQTVNLWHVPGKKVVFASQDDIKKDVYTPHDDISVGAQNYAEDYGSVSFQDFVQPSGNGVQYRGNSSFTDGDYMY